VDGSATKRPSPWLTGMASTPPLSQSLVNGVSTVSTRSQVVSQRNSSEALRVRAPGSR
jgi:hypothetical protein